MKKILITGCSGFLGSHLTGVLENEADVSLSGITEVSDFTSSKLDVYHVDIRERQRVFEVVKALQPHLVFHLAAVANVGFSWTHQALTYEINFIGSSNLVEAISEAAPRCRILLMSSAELYGNCKGDACKESDSISVTSPKNPYSLSKYAMEMVGNLYRQAKQMDIVTVRSFNFTGPGQNDQFVASDFSRQIAEIESGKREWVTSRLSATCRMSGTLPATWRLLPTRGKRGEFTTYVPAKPIPSKIYWTYCSRIRQKKSTW